MCFTKHYRFPGFYKSQRLNINKQGNEGTFNGPGVGGLFLNICLSLDLTTYDGQNILFGVASSRKWIAWATNDINFVEEEGSGWAKNEVDFLDENVVVIQK